MLFVKFVDKTIFWIEIFKVKTCPNRNIINEKENVFLVNMKMSLFQIILMKLQKQMTKNYTDEELEKEKKTKFSFADVYVVEPYRIL